MTQQDATMRLTRRAALGAGAASAVVAALAQVPHGALAAPRSASADQLEPGAGGWRTWVLESGSQLRPPAPLDRAATRSEIDLLQAMTAERDAAALDQVSYWDSGAPEYRWNEIAIAQGLKLAPNRRRRAGSARGRQGPLFSRTPLRDRAAAQARVGQALSHFLSRNVGTGPTC